MIVTECDYYVCIELHHICAVSMYGNPLGENTQIQEFVFTS